MPLLPRVPLTHSTHAIKQTPHDTFPRLLLPAAACSMCTTACLVPLTPGLVCLYVLDTPSRFETAKEFNQGQ